MSQVTLAIRSHHRELAKTLQVHLQELEERRAGANPQALVEFLKKDLLPHAQGEESSLYPLMDTLVRDHGRATATMSVDHEFISSYVRQIEETARAVAAAKNGDRPGLEMKLALLARQLDTLLAVHLEKEERVFLPLFEKYLTEAEQQRALDGMHEAYDEKPSATVKTTLDVRTTPPVNRHPLIFQTFESLRPGEAFVLINDHDPKPLYYQFKFEREGQFTWEYEAQGPQVWQVRVGKLK
jgi:uncharacterized protein (DUF2249 family)/hemerythrin-like domain-containing protein